MPGLEPGSWGGDGAVPGPRAELQSVSRMALKPVKIVTNDPIVCNAEEPCFLILCWGCQLTGSSFAILNNQRT